MFSQFADWIDRHRMDAFAVFGVAGIGFSLVYVEQVIRIIALILTACVTGFALVEKWQRWKKKTKKSKGSHGC
jgi:hypothetical protein